MNNQIQLLTENSTPDIFPSEFSNNIYLSILDRNKKLEDYSYQTTFSLKMCMTGYEAYFVNNRYKKLEAGSCIFVNCGDQVRTTKVAGEGMSIFFESLLFKNAIKGLHSDAADILELDKELSSNSGLMNEPVPACKSTTQFLRYVNQKFKTKSNTLFLIDDYLELLRNVFLDFGLIKKELTKFLDIKKQSTRLELYRRLTIAQSFIHDCSNAPISLDEVSQVALISPYHLARLFKILYGQSPIKYHMVLRVEKAKKLLISASHLSISDIANALNYNDPQHFSNQFKAVSGYTPSAFRKLSNP